MSTSQLTKNSIDAAAARYASSHGQTPTPTAPVPVSGTATAPTTNTSPNAPASPVGASNTSQTPPATPAPATPTTPSSSDDISNQKSDLSNLQDQRTQNADDFQVQSAKVQKTLDNIMNGSMPLNDGQVAQISGLRQSYQALIDQQTQANTGSTGLAQIRGYQTGAAEYDPTFQAKTIGAIVTSGINKVADLNTKMASAVADITSSFEKDDAALVKDSWDAYKDAATERDDALQKTIEDTQAAIKTAQDAQQKVTDDVNAIAIDAAKNGADAKTVSAIASSGSVSEAVNAAGDTLQTATGQLGDYLAYKRQAILVGHTPLDYDSWRDSEDQRALNLKSKEAYASAYATASAQNAFAGSDKNQQKLEKDYATTLIKELSNRSGGLGLQDQKVNQAIHLRALLDQYKDPKTGVYNVPAAQYSELAMGLANLISGSGAVSDSARESINTKTAAGDIKGALTYVTGTPFNGTTQEVLSNLADSIDRQGKVAEDLRNQSVQFLQGLAPTDLDPDRKAALEENTLASYTNPTKDPNIDNENKAQDSVKEYISVHPDKSDEINNHIKIMETTLGRPITTVEFLQAFPEYQ